MAHIIWTSSFRLNSLYPSLISMENNMNNIFVENDSWRGLGSIKALWLTLPVYDQDGHDVTWCSTQGKGRRVISSLDGGELNLIAEGQLDISEDELSPVCWILKQCSVAGVFRLPEILKPHFYQTTKEKQKYESIKPTGVFNGNRLSEAAVCST